MNNDVNVRNLQGEKGFEIIADTSVHAGPYRVLLSRDDATEFDTGTTERVAGSLATKTLDRGERIFGYFTDVKLSGGEVWAEPI